MAISTKATTSVDVNLGAGTTETTIWTPATGKKFNLTGFMLTAGASTTLIFRDNTAGTVILRTAVLANSPFLLDLKHFSQGKLSAAANNVLTVERGTSATLVGTLFGTEE